jgi:uncharacterized protein
MKKRPYSRPKISKLYGKRKTRKRSYRKAGKKLPVLTFITFLLFIFILGIVFYTLFIFPSSLNKRIKNDLVSIYRPERTDEDGDILILRLVTKPSNDDQIKAFKMIKDKYSLSILFEKIASAENKGINRIKFLKNGQQFEDLKPVYIYWDEAFSGSAEEYKEKPEKTFVRIDELVKEKKQEELSEPSAEKFRYNLERKEHPDVKNARLAIVIDDVGYSYNSTYDFLSLGFPVTFAVIPDLPGSRKFYELFRKYGYDMLIHIPMEPLKGRKYVEDNAIFTDMSDNDIRKRIDHFLSEYPDAIGANNHMGSKAVTDPRLLNDVFAELSRNNKVWLDSMTSVNSLSKDIALVNGLSYFKRDVFFDNYKDRESIKMSMDKLIQKAKANGYAVGIGHIQSRELVSVLKEYYGKRNELGIEFVPLNMVK